MTFVDILEKDRPQLLSALAAAESPEKASAVIDQEIGRLLLFYNDACNREEERDAAAVMLQPVQIVSALVNTLGDIRIWENKSAEARSSKRKFSPLQILLCALSGICAICSLLAALMTDPSSARAADVILAVLTAAASPVLAFLAGRLGNKGKDEAAGMAALRAEPHVDPERIYTVLHNAVYAVDRNLMQLPSAQTADPARRSLPDERTMDLLAELLEALYSADGEYALEKLEGVRLYLHRAGIETADYDEHNRELFDVMPSGIEKTIRPALTADGCLIRRGIAAGR